jgi:hypothetical protein
MLDRKMTAPTGGETKKRFIDMFSLSPSRYSLEGKKSNA